VQIEQNKIARINQQEEFGIGVDSRGPPKTGNLDPARRPEPIVQGQGLKSPEGAACDG
jgi:hypothetical protein